MIPPTIEVRPGVHICPLLPVEFCQRIAQGEDLTEKQEELLTQMLPQTVVSLLADHDVKELYLSGMHPFTAEKGDKLLPVYSEDNKGMRCLVNIQKADKGGDIYLPRLRWSGRDLPAGWGTVFKGSESFGINRVHSGEVCLLLLDFQHGK